MKPLGEEPPPEARYTIDATFKVFMPEMDGIALVRAIRALPSERGGQTPAIALTAFARAEDRQRALAAGYQEHLSKPVEIAPLSIAVARLGLSPTPS